MDSNTELVVFTSEITNSNLKVATNPITPLISIEVSQPLKKALKVLIPIEKKENEVVAAVQYQFDENVINTLESVFTEDEVLEVMIYATTDFFVSSVAEDLVLATIDTGFRPSVDGFQTNNISTYWENGGMCSGMVNGSLYYYLAKKPSLGPLYNRYHENSGMPFTTPNFWNDDFLAISLTTTLQNVSYHEDYYDYFNFTRLDSSAKHFYRMAYHMMISNKPQIIHLFDKPFTPDRSNDPLVGHSVIAYKILANHVYVYDPNYPNNDSLKIELDTSSENIKPYVGALSSESKQSSFTNMYYYPSNIILNTQGLDPYFTKIENNEAIVTLPEYNLVEVLKNNNSTNYIKLSNNHKTHKNTIDITLTLPKNGFVKVYDKNQAYIELINNNIITLSLPDENNYFGFEIFFPSSVNSQQKVYTDFQWINIQKVDYEAWTATSTFTSVNPDNYSENEINQMLNFSFTTPLLVLYDEENQQFDTFNPENNQKVVMKKSNNNISYEISYPVNNKTITNTFNGTISDDLKSITGTSVFLTTSDGELYRMYVVMQKNE